MKFLVQSRLSKNLFELSYKQSHFLKNNSFLKKLLWRPLKGILNLVTLFLRFMFLQPRMLKQISPNHFEEANERKPWVGQFYV